MDSDNESYHSESEVYYLDKDFRHFRPFQSIPLEKIINTLFAGLGRPISRKTVPSVSSMAETSGTVFPHPDLPDGK